MMTRHGVTVLVREERDREVIAEACPDAKAAGVRSGMTMAHARALLPDTPIQRFPSDPEGDATALHALARWALRLAPRVMPDPPCGMLLDITGCERVFRGEQRFMNSVVNAFAWIGVTARVACAGTYGCAWGMARYGTSDEGIQVSNGAEAHALSPLPIDALRLDTDTIAGLREVGVDLVGHVLAIPRRELGTRFARLPGARRGDGAITLQRRLEAALGERSESIESVRTVELPRVARVFDGPVSSSEGIRRTVTILLAALCDQLRQRESGVRRLHLIVERADLDDWSETIVLSHPSRDPRHLGALLAPRVDALPMGFGVESLTLVAAECGRVVHAQAGLDGRLSRTARDEEVETGELLDVLVDRLGASRVLRAVPHAAHLPERAFTARGIRETTTVGAHRAAHAAAVPVRAREHPSRLFTPPERIDVEPDDHGLPARLHWRGDVHHVRSRVGPERLAEAWWARDDRTIGNDDLPASASVQGREYYRVQDAGGRWLWIYRQIESGVALPEPLRRRADVVARTERWFVHGEWS